MNRKETTAANYPIKERFPSPICLLGLLNGREEIRIALSRRMKPKSVARYAVERKLDPDIMVSEYQNMQENAVDFDTAFEAFMAQAEHMGILKEYEIIERFMKRYSIRYHGTFSRNQMKEKMRARGYHILPSMYRKIDLELWNSDDEMVLEAYIPAND